MERSKYALVFSDHCKRNENILEYVKKQVQKHHLNCEMDSCKDPMLPNSTSVLVTATFDWLAIKAEDQQMDKQLAKEHGYYKKFTKDRLSDFKGSHKKATFFTPAEEGRLLHDLLQSISYEPEILKGFGFDIEPGKPFLDALQDHSKPAVLESTFLVHQPVELTKINKHLWASFLPWKELPINSIRDYFDWLVPQSEPPFGNSAYGPIGSTIFDTNGEYKSFAENYMKTMNDDEWGEDVALYFGWMKFFSTFLCYSSVVGLIMYFMRPSGASIDNDPYVPLFSLFMAVWGVLFLIFWQRRCSEYTFHWHSYKFSKKEELRSEFYGTMEPHPVTGIPSLYYPHWKRRLRYLFSLVITIPMLLLGVLVMILSLNLNGYIRDKNSPIHVSYLATFAEPGGWFAADNPYYGYMLPVIGHSLIIYIINQLYGKVAKWCTDSENHRDIHSWHNSLVVKRVLFECADCFLPLFYIAFYQFDVEALRNELIGLFYTDEIRRVMMETVIPTITSAVKRIISKADVKSSQFHKDIVKDEYEQFDDYLEMVVQFGYITLFASAFPLASVVSLVFLYIELKSDLFKLLWTYRRPYPRRGKDIGVWQTVMKAMVYISILTNCFILGFSSEQLMQWLPQLFTRNIDDGDQAIALGSGRYVVLIVFTTEHLLMLVALILEWLISTAPKKVYIGIAKQEYWSSKNK